MNVFDKKIILASKSPRRSQLLKAAGFQFEVRTKEVEETYPEDLAVEEVPVFLARKKAMAMFNEIGPSDILLAADSIVVLDQTIFGKPKDEEDAKATLRQLSGNVHQVITGVCLRSISKEVVFSGVSKVHMNELSEEEIDYYIKNFQPFDKAGAYAIQEWIGLCKISKIEGVYSNIVGLPVEQVYEALRQF